MFIQTEQTPNPQTLKFIPGMPVMEAGVFEFEDGHAAQASPLAEKLFQIQGVTRVFYGADFISVSKNEMIEWDYLKTRIMAAIMDHFTTGMPLFKEGFGNKDSASEESEAGSAFDSEIVLQVKELIDTRVRPMVAMDGGDIIFKSMDQDGVVYLKMRGACSGCPSSTVTLKSGIENMLKHFVPEVSEVKAVEDY